MATKPQVILACASHSVECIEEPRAAVVTCACVLGIAETDEAWRCHEHGQQVRPAPDACEQLMSWLQQQ